MTDSILLEAQRLVYSDRNQQYGDSNELIQKVLASFEALTNIKMSPSEAYIFMTLLKLGRDRFKYKRDNVADAAGYLELYNKAREKEEKLF